MMPHSTPAAASYAQPRRIDFGATGASPLDANAIDQRKKAMQLERFLTNSPFARQKLEMMMGGRIRPDGVADGVLQVEPFQYGSGPGPGAPAALNPAMASMGGLQQGASMLGPDPFGQNLFQQMMLGALVNTLTSAGPNPAAGMGGGLNPGAPAGLNPGAPAGLNPGAPAGLNPGAPAPMPPQANGLNPGAGLNPGFGNLFGGGLGGGLGGTLGGIMGAPGMTVEDQVVMLLMQISKRFDQQMQQQANAINQMQQQQQGGGGQAGGSIDVATMKLKRLIDKRGQMFDMLRQIIDKYNETAKNMIGMMNR